MCGIVGYIEKQKALPILIDGIRNIEYRGYDSAGFALVAKNGTVKNKKSVGRVSALEEKTGDPEKFAGNNGIIHSRWATHGPVSEENAHPHTDCKENIWLVHNGIIENYAGLKEGLINSGHSFRSETDTEVLAHLVEEFKIQNPFMPIEDAFRLALLTVRGAYGVALFDSREPGKLIAARNFSPLVLGIGSGEHFVASDASAILKHTPKVVYLDDGEMAVITPKEYKVFDLRRNIQNKPQKV